MTLAAAHLGVRRRRDQRYPDSGHREGLHLPPPWLPCPNLLCRRIMARTDRSCGANSPFRNSLFQHLLMAKARELIAGTGNFNRHGIKLGGWDGSWFRRG
jgi:hypothetical protein